MDIRVLTVKDWEQFKQIRLKALQTDPQAFFVTYEKELETTDEEWQDKLQKQTKVYVGSFKEDSIIGLAGAFTMDTPQEWILISVYVDPEFRGQDIAGQLVRVIEDVVKEKGATRLSLLVNEHMTSAVRLYEKIGFEIVETVPDQTVGDGSVVSEYRMVKQI